MDLKQEKLPVYLTAILKADGIYKGGLQYMAPVDMNTAGEFVDGYILVTQERLVVAQTRPDREKMKTFKGYGREALSEAKDWAYRSFLLEELKHIRIEEEVGCNLLLVELKEGREIPLASFTNLYRRKIYDLVRNLEKYLQKGTFRPQKPEEEEYCPKCGRMYPDPMQKICPHCANHRSVFLRVLVYFKPYWAKLLLLFCGIFLTAVLNLVWPYLNGTVLYDYVLAKDNTFLERMSIPQGKFVYALGLVVLTMLLSKVMMLLTQLLQGVASATLAINVVRDMKKDIFARMGELSIAFYRNRRTGQLMTRVMNDADRVTNFFVDTAPYLLTHVVTVIMTVIVMMSINWQMTVLALLMVPMLTVVCKVLQPYVWIMFGRRHRAERSLNSSVSDNLTGARVVKAFGQEEREVRRFATYSERLRRTEVSISYWQNYFQLFFGGAQELITIAAWSLGTYFILGRSNVMNLGVLITFVGYVGQLQSPMKFFSQVSNKWADSMNSAERMFEIMDAIPEVREVEEPVPLPEPKGELTLENVSFGYEINRLVLKDINIHIKEGSVIGIVGRSGAGKSTLVNLISRMYDPTEGRILLDGVDIKQLSFHELRRNIALVSQDTFIFQGTVASNIAYSRPDASPWEIVEAAKLAGAHEFIMRMEDGYESAVGTAGRALSGGEKQRISIARAILANPKVLILDEATASVDTETERLIQNSLNYLVKGRTTISIAHRLSTLRDADYLFVIDHGRVVEQGTHEELEAQRGIFYKLKELQTKVLAMKGLED